jgi:acetolactate synthase-1/2/3 large subunit
MGEGAPVEPLKDAVDESASADLAVEVAPEALLIESEPEVEAAVEAQAEPTAEPEPEVEAEPELVVEAAAEPEVTVEPKTVGRVIADALHAAGVTVAFTVPGESFLGLIDGLRGAGIRLVTTRHEGGAAFMAEAHGQLTGRPAACLGTRAVGAANLAIGLHTARSDSTPMFAIVGGVSRAFRGREAFQEIDVVGSIGRMAKWAVEIDELSRVEPLIAEAVRHAGAGRPGPVVITVPEDLLDEIVPGAPIEPAPFRAMRIEPDPGDVRAVLQLLAGARRPVILAGAGVLRSRGSADLIRLAELLEVPVIASWRRADVFPNDHRLYLGMTGYGSPHSVQARLDEADAVVVLGCRLNEIASFGYAVPGPGIPWAHVDVEPRAAHGGLAGPTLAVTTDARTFLRVARRSVSNGVLAAEPYDARRSANEADREAYEAASRVDGVAWDGPGVHPGKVIATLNAILPPQTIVTTDAGNFAGWAARGYRFRRPGTFLGPTSGAMGYALPAAIAAALEHPGRPVVALAGDGGFAMTMNELETAVREGTRIVAIVFDNERYGTIGVYQEGRGTGLADASELGPIDFAAVARGMGALGVHVDDDAAFEPALREALGADRTTVIHVRLDRRWKVVGRLDPA